MRAAAAVAAMTAIAWTGAAQAADGAQVFGGTCQTCHAESGVGTPGLAPPLVSPVIANAATKQKDYPTMVVLSGLTGSIPLAAGGTLSSAMAPQQGLSDDEVAAVVSYLYRLNHAKMVIKPADVARVRAQPASGDDLKRMRLDLMK
jgi:mono/diheme cytochrome c family protein